MEPITKRIYGFVNPNGETLQLRLGYDHKAKLDDPTKKDTGYRWSFVGKCIPMPIRANTWFNGFSEEIMLNWLKSQGWYMETKVNMLTSKATVYELPFCKNLSENELINGKQAIYKAVLLLCAAGHKDKARALTRLVSHCSFHEAFVKVDEISDAIEIKEE